MLFKKRAKDTTLERLIKIRGGRRLSPGITDTMPGGSTPPRRWRTRALNRQIDGWGRTNYFQFTGQNRGDFYRWIRDSIPIISAGVWTWVRLCATELSRQIEGTQAARRQAALLLEQLDQRVLESPYGRGSGLVKLVEAYFLELFTTGRFAGEAVLTEEGGSVDHFRYIDPYTVQWEHTERGWTPYIVDEEERRESFDPQLFFYGVFGADLSNPAGVEPLACIPFVAEVEQLMLEDIARSSHNAGTPRMQIKITRPPRNEWESDDGYSQRANGYFTDIVREFNHLEPDDNLFTWDDVEVTVVGANNQLMNWRLNREQVIEDVVTGLRLFPWVLGRSHKTTMNWVQSQFDLLMQMVYSRQRSGLDLIDWLCNMELRLQHISAAVRHQFQAHPDPFRLERAQAQEIEIRSVDFKVLRGYISKQEGARELGYPRTFREDEEK